jgi:predicted AlkP superfamily phosphohydrolase/phosphomutase
LTAETGDPIRDVYVAIDDAIADILSDVDSETLIVLLACHGMSHRHGAQFLLHDILVRLRAAAPEQPRGGGLGPPARVLRWGWVRTPEVARQPIRLVRDRIHRWGDYGSPALPPEARDGRCFALNNGLAVGGIRLNLFGREPQGMLTPDSEQEFCQELTQDFLDIVDMDSGRPIIKRVMRTVDLYRGEYIHHLPDLLVAWSDDKALGSTTVGSGRGARVLLTSGKIGIVEGSNGYCRSGDHRRDGFFVAVGSALSPGRMSRTVSIMDFAPTFTRFLGVELPEADGDPIPELLAGVRKGLADRR